MTHDSPILDVAGEVSAIIRAQGLEAAVIGGVAVVLHGHVRTTLDVDVYAADADQLAGALRAAGFAWDAKHKQFSKAGVPVQIVTPQHVSTPPRQYQDLQGIRTVSLADLINIKLRSGSSNILRAQDMADVIGLLQHHAITSRFLPRIDKDLRPTFRQLLRELRRK